MKHKKIIFWFSQLFIFLIALNALPSVAKEAPIYTSLFSNVAISGYDPVAYFTESKPVKGDSSITLSYQGADWHFANVTNRDKFASDPLKYAPQYGGYCAWAVSQGSTASADPLRWRIVGEKLYLNYDEAVQKKWDANQQEFIQKANRNWPKVLD